jgi:S1-C subfamily serine protease
MELASDAAHTSRRTAIVQAAERVGPAVVSISVARRQRAQPRSLFEQFFLPPGYEREVAGLGSGFVVSREGLVVTNEHVVRGADRVVVTLPDGREFDAEILGTDDANDLAVLRLDLQAGEEVPVAPLGSSDQLLVGEWAVAIGNPLGFLLSNHEPAVTAGVVSAVGRNILPSGEDRRTYYLDMIQTDASINPGNSGGPLVNALGEVIGVNSSILSRGGGSEGLGFAIPINRARRVVMDLVESGSVRRAWLGVEVEAAEPGGIRRVQEVRIARVTPGSPAAEAGLRAGSLVREIGGRHGAHPPRLGCGPPRRAGGRCGAGDAGRRPHGAGTGGRPSLGGRRADRSAARFRAGHRDAGDPGRARDSQRGGCSHRGDVGRRQAGGAAGGRCDPAGEPAAGSERRGGGGGPAAMTSGSGVLVYFERGGRLGSTSFRIR